MFRRNVIEREVLEEIARQVDAVEGWNCRNILASSDTKAREVARQAGKPISVGSDSHSPWEMGGVWTEIEDFETPAEFVAALEQGESLNRDPTADEVRHAIAGNLCRCTGYQLIVQSVLEAAKLAREAAPATA